MRAFKPIWPQIPQAHQQWRVNKATHQLLHIEIGAGVGMHAIQLAKSNPDIFVVALERTEEKSEKMLRRVTHHQPLPNLYALRADAIQWIWQNIAPAEVDQYYILYPNPHPKQSQANQRWLKMPFFGYLMTTLVTGGKITLATNMEYYFQEICHEGEQTWGLDLLVAGQLPADYNARTHFERKYLARGEACYECVLVKK